MHLVHRLLGWLAPACLLLVIVGFSQFVANLVGFIQQTPVQRGIDAHPALLTATYTDIDSSSNVSDDTYYLSYVYNGEEFSTTLRSLPGTPEIGDQFCVEVDATQPENGRVCGTQGDLDNARSGMVWSSVILAAALGVLFAWYLSTGASAPTPASPRRRNRRTRRRR